VQYRESPATGFDAALDVPITPKTGGVAVPLLQVATLSRHVAVGEVRHENIQRVLQVLANVRGRDVGSVSADIERSLAAMTLPKGARVEVRGETATMRRSFADLAGGIGLAVMLVYLLLVAQFRSFRAPLLVLAAVPLGAVGALGLLLITGSTLNVQSLVGMLFTVGIAVSNSVLLVDFSGRLRAEGRPALDAAREAALVRLRPILMTSLAAILGLLPMAIGFGRGSEANVPLARAVVGGLTASTIRYAWSNVPRVRAAAAVTAVSEARRAELKAGYLPVATAGGLYTKGFPGSCGNLGPPRDDELAVRSHVGGGPRGELVRARVPAHRSARRGDVRRGGRRAGGTGTHRARRGADDGRSVERTLAAEAALRIADADIVARCAHVDALAALAKAGGSIPESDVLQARASLARAEADRMLAAADRDGLRGVLAILVGDQRMVSVTLLLDAPTIDGGSDPDAAAARAHREAARRLRDVAWRDVLPRVVVSGSVGYANTPPGQDPGYWAAGIGLVIPLTSYFVEEARAEAAARAADARAHEADARAQELALQRVTLRAMRKALDAAIAASDATVIAARDALAAIEARVKGGLAREVEVETVRLAVIRAEVDAATLRVRADAIRARLAWMGG